MKYITKKKDQATWAASLLENKSVVDLTEVAFTVTLLLEAGMSTHDQITVPGQLSLDRGPAVRLAAFGSRPSDLSHLTGVML